MSESGIEAESVELSDPNGVPTQRVGAPLLSRTPNWVSLEIPADWFWKESFTLLAPDGSANVIASTEPLDPGISLDQYAEIQGDLLSKEFPQYQQFRFEPAMIEGVAEARLREFAWTPDDGERIHQIQVYAVRDSRGITATATTPESAWEPNRHHLQQAIFSLVVDPT